MCCRKPLMCFTELQMHCMVYVKPKVNFLSLLWQFVGKIRKHINHKTLIIQFCLWLLLFCIFDEFWKHFEDMHNPRLVKDTTCWDPTRISPNTETRWIAREFGDIGSPLHGTSTPTSLTLRSYGSREFLSPQWMVHVGRLQRFDLLR